jgi:uncharacterized protein (DUF2062 family)
MKRPRTTSTKPSGCGCRDKANAVLAEHNTRLVENIGMLMHPRRAARSLFRFTTDRILVATEKVDASSRKRSLVVAATFCPFCGKKLPETAS